MYEVFMTAFINDVDFRKACSFLRLYCYSDQHQRIHRVLYFAGTNPNQPKGITKRNSVHGIPPEPDIFSLGLPGAEAAPDPSSRYLDPMWNEVNDVLKKSVFACQDPESHRKLDADTAPDKPLSLTPATMSPRTLTSAPLSLSAPISSMKRQVPSSGARSPTHLASPAARTSSCSGGRSRSTTSSICLWC